MERDVGNITSLTEVSVFWWVSAMYDADQQGYRMFYLLLRWSCCYFRVYVWLCMCMGVRVYIRAGIEVVSLQCCPDCGHQKPHKSWASDGFFRFPEGEWLHFLRITLGGWCFILCVPWLSHRELFRFTCLGNFPRSPVSLGRRAEENQFWDLPHLRPCPFSTEEWLMLFLMTETQSNSVFVGTGDGQPWRYRWSSHRGGCGKSLF